MSVHLLAPAKLTLSLRITGVRTDGYHEIDAEMVTLDLADELWISPADEVSVRYRLADPPGGALQVGADDLVTRALRTAGRSAKVRVLKHIPAGAGLGGGSADAAAVLRWAGFSDTRRAVQIGADVAFCLVGGRARVTGIGELIEPLKPDPATFTLLTPPLHCSTPVVYRRWDELGGPVGDNGNDLEPAALDAYPGLAEWRERLEAGTGLRPRLAGSGSTWFVPGSYPDHGRVVITTDASG